MIKRAAVLLLALLMVCSAAFPPAYAEETSPSPGGGAPTDSPTEPPAETQTPAASPEPAVTPTPPQTAAPTPTPAVTPTPTPAASPTPSPSPSPSATPQATVTFSGGSDTTVTLMDKSYDPLGDIWAYDENGNSVAVYLIDNGGFDVTAEGDYTLKYAANHPATNKRFVHTRVIYVRMSEEQKKYKIEFSGAAELYFRVGAASADLLGDATAVDETGAPVGISIKDNGGFDINTVGTYTVTYAAAHPVLGATFTASRPAKVLSEKDYDSMFAPANPLAGKSNSRYYKYLKYREEIYAQLQGSMIELTQKLASRIDIIAGALGYAEYRMVRALPALEDDSEITDEAAEVTESVAQTFSPADTELYEELDTVSVSNWADILAVFVATSTLDVDDPLDLYNLRKISFDGLTDVFFDMVELAYHVEDGELWMVLTGYDAYEMMDRLNMEQAQRDALEELMQPEFQSVFASLTGDESFTQLSADDITDIRSALPEGLSVGREAVIMAAYTLLDKVDYFWGGKYNEIGWNSSWGMPRLVTSLRSKTTGKVRPYGLDCSGFVTWSFINGAQDASVADVVGNGSSNQWAHSVSLGWDEAQPGDLAFRRTPSSSAINHVGVVVSKESDGTYMVIHCSSSMNGVVVTEAWSSGFRYMRRPLIFLTDEEIAGVDVGAAVAAETPNFHPCRRVGEDIK